MGVGAVVFGLNLLLATGLAAGVGAGLGAFGRSKKSPAAARSSISTPTSTASTPFTQVSPVATGKAQEAGAPGRGARLSLISTGPQGVFGNAPVGRRKLLGN